MGKSNQVKKDDRSSAELKSTDRGVDFQSRISGYFDSKFEHLRDWLGIHYAKEFEAIEAESKARMARNELALFAHPVIRIVDAWKSELKPLREFGEYIERNTQVLLNIILTGRSSAISEGINRKIQVIKSMAYGYRNINYFMLKIMQRCGVLGSMWKPANL